MSVFMWKLAIFLLHTKTSTLVFYLMLKSILNHLNNCLNKLFSNICKKKLKFKEFCQFLYLETIDCNAKHFQYTRGCNASEHRSYFERNWNQIDSKRKYRTRTCHIACLLFAVCLFMYLYNVFDLEFSEDRIFPQTSRSAFSCSRKSKYFFFHSDISAEQFVVEVCW